jgi:hypothetical protein
MEDIRLKQLRARFVSDLNLPIQVLQNPYFEDRLALCEKDYGAATAYDDLWNVINERFGGNIDKFLEYYHQVRDDIITKVTNSEAYKEFISDNKFVKNFTPICGNRNLYTNEQDGCMFISYDMKKANFQTLKYANPAIVYDTDTYEKFIGKFTDLDYIKNSKYTRQVIFGKMNPKRTMNLEKWITNEFAKELSNDVAMKDYELFSLNADEIIFKFKGTEEEFNKVDIEPTICHFGGSVEFKGSKFKLHARQFKLATSSSILTVYEKEDYLNGHKRILKGVPATYFPQVYKLLNGMEIDPNSDLIFYYEHELCKFLNPLELIK